MTARSMRIKVKVADLIEKMEAVRDSADADYAKALAKHEKGKDVFQQKVYVALRRMVDEFGTDMPFTTTTTYIGSRRCTVVALPFSTEPPTVPTKPNPARINKDIAILKMSADDTISISHDDDYARYL